MERDSNHFKLTSIYLSFDHFILRCFNKQYEVNCFVLQESRLEWWVETGILVEGKSHWWWRLMFEHVIPEIIGL